ncbi:MAG: DUF4105 domain-containing protein [Chitinophagaceae bacterium]|nr:DUF4105 domain-containing protein [Chitinophagaceae bacterium]
MKKTGFSFLVFFLLFYSSANAGSDSSHLRITLLTCSPGEELYSTFGHSALRVIDSATFTDKVYNYGTFDFNPDFYPKFIRGKLLYYLSVEDFIDFLYSYQLEQRSIVEQELNLSGEEKLKLNAALQLNAKESNKYYKYDFLYDNCATRIRDIVKHNVEGDIVIGNILPYPEVTFRALIHNSLNRGRMYWSKLGIDLLLGRGLDQVAQNEQTMFLPDYLYKGFDSAFVGGKPLAGAVNTVFNASPAAPPGKVFFTPFVVFAAGFMFFVALTLVRREWSKRLLGILDFLLILCTGLLGILLVLMWVGTDHILCRNNYNLLWAIPFHAIAAFFLRSNKKIVHQYWALSVLIYVLVLSFWVLLPQELNKDLVPVILLLGWRSWKQFKRTENAPKTTHLS